ncbi:MAG: hypothetical protein PHT69_14120 [Bacteroidales bacterium]|nr:hypothetical protein [Bacteroidales bacterium]
MFAHQNHHPQYFLGYLKSEKLVILSEAKNLNINVLRFFTLFKMTKNNDFVMEFAWLTSAMLSTSRSKFTRQNHHSQYFLGYLKSEKLVILSEAKNLNINVFEIFHSVQNDKKTILFATG